MRSQLRLPESARFTAFSSTALDRTIEIRDYQDVVAILRSPLAKKVLLEEYGREFQAPVLRHTLIELDGPDHIERRRIEAALFRSVSIAYYERDLLEPAISRELEAMSARCEVPGASVDLLPSVRRMMAAVMAAIVGLDGVVPDGVDRFLQLFARLDRCARVRWTARDAEAIRLDALDAMRTFVSDYFGPSHRRRQDRTHSTDRLGSDLITEMLRRPDHFSKWDPGLLGREAALFVSASIANATNAVCSTMYEVEHWCAAHPDLDTGARLDLSFLRRAVFETLRLHHSNVFLLRQLDGDLAIPSGRRLRAGDVVRLLHGVASREGAGHDPDMFDPYRTMPTGVSSYALAFGEGRHTCIGKPLAIGDGSTQVIGRRGTVLAVVSELYRAGVRPAPADPAELDTTTNRRQWSRFPVVSIASEAVN